MVWSFLSKGVQLLQQVFFFNCSLDMKALKAWPRFQRSSYKVFLKFYFKEKKALSKQILSIPCLFPLIPSFSYSNAISVIPKHLCNISYGCPHLLSDLLCGKKHGKSEFLHSFSWSELMAVLILVSSLLGILRLCKPLSPLPCFAMELHLLF